MDDFGPFQEVVLVSLVLVLSDPVKLGEDVVKRHLGKVTVKIMLMTVMMMMPVLILAMVMMMMMILLMMIMMILFELMITVEVKNYDDDDDYIIGDDDIIDDDDSSIDDNEIFINLRNDILVKFILEEGWRGQLGGQEEERRLRHLCIQGDGLTV